MFRIALLAIAALVLVSACDGDDSGGGGGTPAAAAEEPRSGQEEPETTAMIEAGRRMLATIGVRSDDDEHVAYFLDLQAALDLFGGRAAAAVQAVVEAGADDERSALFAAIRNVGAGQAFLPVLERFGEIDPPLAYEADHARLVSLHEELVEIDQRVRQAAVDEDFAAFAIANNDLERAGVLANQDLSPSMCRVVTRGNAPCPSAIPVPGGEYGAALNAAWRRFISLAFFTTGVAALLDLLAPTPEEIAQVAETFIARRIETLEDARAALVALDPPAELADDQARLLAFLDERIERNRALHEGAAAREPGFLEAMIEEEPAIGPICRLFDMLSDRFAAIVRHDEPPDATAFFNEECS